MRSLKAVFILVLFQLSSQAFGQTNSLTASQMFITDIPYMNDYGAAYPGEGWDIGAYQYFPGVYIGMPLLYSPLLPFPNPLTNAPAAPSGLTLTNATPMSTPTGPTPTQVITTLLTEIAGYAATQPVATTFPELYDVVRPNYSFKFFLTNGSPVLFQYNGTLSGQHLWVADDYRSPGLPVPEYLVALTPLTPVVGMSLLAQVFTSTEMIALKSASLFQVTRDIFIPSKKIHMDFDSSFYPTVLTDPAAIARLSQNQGTAADASAVNAALYNVITGAATAAQTAKVTVTYSLSISDPTYALYIGLLNLIVTDLGIQPAAPSAAPLH